jgi:peroxiredoxin
MRRVVEFGFGCRFLGFAMLMAAIATGCGAAPESKTTTVATKTEPKAGVAADASTVTSNEPAPEVAAGAAPVDEPAVRDNPTEPQPREAAKPVVEEYAANVPPVLLSAAHRKLCKVFVGDSMPAVELPKLDGGNANLESLAGSKATVVLFWTKDHWMSETALRDLARDVAGRYPNDAVAVVGVAVNLSPADAQPTVAAAAAKFPQLVDADGKALAPVGEGSLPRTYVLDGQRRIAWFDIEYSEATRRELHQTLAALAGEPSK